MAYYLFSTLQDIIRMNYCCRKYLLGFSTFLLSLTGAGQTKKFDSSFVHQWAVVVTGDNTKIETGKKPFDAYPSELPTIIEFFSNGTLTLGSKKGSWAAAAKNILQIVVDGKSSRYRVSELQNKKLKLQELSGKKKMLLLTQLD